MPLGPMRTKAEKRAGVHQVMDEWKHGQLHSGSKHGPVVHSQKQAIAIALSQTGQGRSKHADGGGIVPPDPEHPLNEALQRGIADSVYTSPGVAMKSGGAVRTGYAFGGMQAPPFFAREEAYGEDKMPSGFVRSAVPGRTDQLPLSPAAGSYVIPADVVSGLGEGNSLAGAALLDKMLHSGPYGQRLPREGHRSTIPRPPSSRLPREDMPTMSYGGVAPGLARGGGFHYAPSASTPGFAPMHAETSGFHGPAAPHGGAGPKGAEGPQAVPIIVAGGEYVVPPHVVQHHPLLGNGDLKHGHDVLDKWVKRVRARTVKTTAKLPGPKT